MKKVLAMAMFSLATSHTLGQDLKYPTPPTDNTVDDYFGVKISDPYRPLEDDHSKATLRWVKEENLVTQDYLAKIPFRGKLLKRLREVYDYGKVSAPFFVKATGKWYFYKNNGLQNQSVLYEMDRLGEEKNARIFLDPNELSLYGILHFSVGERLVGILCDGYENASSSSRPHRMGQVLWSYLEG